MSVSASSGGAQFRSSNIFRNMDSYRPVLLGSKEERQPAVPRLPALEKIPNKEGQSAVTDRGLRQRLPFDVSQQSSHQGAMTDRVAPLPDRQGPETLDDVGNVISEALLSLRERVKGDTQGIRDIQGTLVRRIGLLKKKLKEANAEREAETEHSRRLSDAFAREMEKAECLRRELEERNTRCGELESQLRDLQTRYFRSTELASISAVPDEYVEVLKGENESLHEELRRLRESTEKDEKIQKLQCDLDMQRPLIEQLRKDLTESCMRNKELVRQTQQLSLENEELRMIRRPTSSRLSNQRSGMMSVVAESENSRPSEFDLEEHVRVNIDFFGVAAGGSAVEKTR